MNNLDTTTPMSEFNVVDENGNTTVVPLSVPQKRYEHRIEQDGMTCIVINNSPDVFTILTLNKYLYDNRYNAQGIGSYPVRYSEYSSDTSILNVAWGIYAGGPQLSSIFYSLKAYAVEIVDGAIDVNWTSIVKTNKSALKDTVREL